MLCIERQAVLVDGESMEVTNPFRRGDGQKENRLESLDLEVKTL